MVEDQDRLKRERLQQANTPPSYRVTVQYKNGYYRLYDIEYSQAFAQTLETMLKAAEEWYPLIEDK